ncbi:MAG: response regulator [Chloroflexi bacterium]|nr:response regulator [Chloroflexota bacterium]
MQTITDPQNPLTNWTVLVVDDEPDSRDVAQMMLEIAGATVHTAEHGKEALELLRTQRIRPDFILCDLSMPVMDGWQLMFQLSDNRATSDIPVIALTAHAMRGDRDRALAAGFCNHITKPLNASKFMDQLMRILVDLPEFERAFAEINSNASSSSIASTGVVPNTAAPSSVASTEVISNVGSGVVSSVSSNGIRA